MPCLRPVFFILLTISFLQPPGDACASGLYRDTAPVTEDTGNNFSVERGPAAGLFATGPLAAGISAGGAPAAGPPAADPIRFMRDPHVAGGLLVFSYQGDLWLTRSDGSDPRRLTNHVARDVAPRFSADGRWVAFSSDRFGNYDVWLIPVEGGEPTQLTFHTANDMVAGWTPDGRVIFTTSRGPHPFLSPAYTVSTEGGLPEPMEMDQAAAAAVSPDGRYLAFNRIGVNTTRKGYKGNRAPDLYVMDRESGVIRQLTDTNLQDFREHVPDGEPMWGADGVLYFLSEAGGAFNIWKISPDGSGRTQVTFHEVGVKYPAMSPDGRTIVYTQDHELWTLSVLDGEPVKVPVSLAFDPSVNRVEWVDVSNEAEGFSVSPDGKSLAVDHRGEIFRVPVDPEKGENLQVTASAWRDRYQKFSPDGALLAYVSDEGAREELWVWEAETGERRRLTELDSFMEGGFVWSPDGSRIALETANTLYEVDVAGGDVTELAHHPNRGFALWEYAPDGQWLLYGKRDLDENDDLFLLNTATREEVNVTPNPFRELGGALTPDGKHLVFRSTRDEGNYHLFVVSLARLSEDPEDPLVKGREDDSEKAGSGTGEAGGGGSEGGHRSGGASEQAEALVIHPDGIDARARQLTSGEHGAGEYFLSADGEKVFYVSQDDEGPGLFSIPVSGGEGEKVAEGRFGNLQPTRDGKAVFFFRSGSGSRGAPGSGSEIFKMALGGSSPKAERVDFAFPVKVGHRAEWEQIFQESWRVMRFRFYDPEMHGTDWNAVRARYEPLLAHVGTYEDAYDLANQMIGELNASHVGVRGPSSVEMETEYRTRLPGFEMAPEDGAYRVTHIYRDGPADKEWLELEVGDWVLAVDGTPIRAGDNYWKLLNQALNEYVTVQVADSPEGNNARDLRIRSVTSLRDVQYQEWVEENREYVEEISDGEIAYVHIRAMNQPSLRVFENDINRFWNARGIIVDIRYNGGGNIDQQILDILERRPYEYWNYRWAAPQAGRRPRQAIAGPKVMLINHRSASDSEVTPLGFRDLELGRIVGNPTMGAVIATGSYGLMNGATIRTPGSLVVSYDPTKPDNYGINLENYGVAPDVWAENTPEDELQGFDRELKAAVDEALRMLKEGVYQYQGGGG
ncbi:MAG: S41 family peptidase [Longimicrobiales bacterium]